MCGRFVQFWFDENIIHSLGVSFDPHELKPNYNVAPSQNIAAAIHDKEKRLVNLNWGLVPSWSQDLKIGARLINARSETAAEKPSFRAAFKKRRCLIPANGFYEWTGEKGNKQPYYCTVKDSPSIAFAGLWEIWTPKSQGLFKEPPHFSFTILTTEASTAFKDIHHRMPVILAPQAFDQWLDPENQDVNSLKHLMNKSIFSEISAQKVSKMVNSVKNNSPDCIKPLD